MEYCKNIVMMLKKKRHKKNVKVYISAFEIDPPPLPRIAMVTVERLVIKVKILIPVIENSNSQKLSGNKHIYESSKKCKMRSGKSEERI